MAGTVSNGADGDAVPSTQPSDLLSLTPGDLPAVWGRLLPTSGNYPTVDLRDSNYTFGRDFKSNLFGGLGTHIQITSEMAVGKKYFDSISKLHFCIMRDAEKKTVFIEDKSSNGTFINKQRVIGKKFLKHLGFIGIVKENINVFQFLDLTVTANEHGFPAEVVDKYTVTRRIGRGASGDVYLVYADDNKRYAMKVIAKSHTQAAERVKSMNSSKRVNTEIEILKSLNHPGVIKVVDIFDHKDQTFVVMDFMEGGELMERLKKEKHFSETQCKFFLYQLLLSVQYMHHQGITHRDLKPQNILLESQDSETVVKVTDFGLSKLAGSSEMVTMCGSLAYMAPELLNNHGKEVYTQKVDIWSLGIILYVCLIGEFPYKCSQEEQFEMREIIKYGKISYNDEKLSKVSDEARSVIEAMLNFDPKKRANAEQLLNSKWFQDKDMRKKVHSLMKFPDNHYISAEKQELDKPRDEEDDTIKVSEAKRPRLEKDIPATEDLPEDTPTTSSQNLSYSQMITHTCEPKNTCQIVTLEESFKIL